jgi:serine/threonine protein kinase
MVRLTLTYPLLLLAFDIDAGPLPSRSRSSSSFQPRTHLIPTDAHTLLQLARAEPYAAEPVDMWSAGILLFTLLCGSTSPLSSSLSPPDAPPSLRHAMGRANTSFA